MINNDSSEGAQLFDNAVLVKVMGMYKYYYKQACHDDTLRNTGPK